MVDKFMSNTSFKLKGVLTTAGTSVAVSEDLERGLVITTTGSPVVLKDSSGTIIERFIADFAGGVMTIVKRGLDQSETVTEVPALKHEWRTGTTGYISALAPDFSTTLTPIDDSAYGVAWDNDTTHGASRNALYDKIEAIVAQGFSKFWTIITATKVTTKTCTVATDKTAVFKKGMVIIWKEGGVQHAGMVSIPSTYAAPDTTITFIGDNMDATPDVGTFQYTNPDLFFVNFAVAGAIGATGTDIASSWYADKPYRVIGADISVGTAGVTDNTTVDINKNGTTMFTTKPTLATTVASSPLPFTADDSTSLALGDKITIDCDAIQGTAAVDLYVKLYIIPTRLFYLV